MNGIHDMGGMQGFGRVEPEAAEPVFHAPWEGRVLAMNRAAGCLGLWNIDIARFSREQIPAPVYLGCSYYEKWTIGLETLCQRFGLADAAELEAGRALAPPTVAGRALSATEAPRVFSRGNFERKATTVARFKPGDRVLTRNLHPEGHTRLPRYARGRHGEVEAIRGCHVFPDAVAAGQGEMPHWLYTVIFEARELWGDSADPTAKVSIDAWEPYLEPA